MCSNPDCEYYRITDESIHALVRYGCHGKQEQIQDLKCQACGKKFTSRRNAVLYRLKTHSGLVEKILWLLALGVVASALEEVFGVREIHKRDEVGAVAGLGQVGQLVDDDVLRADRRFLGQLGVEADIGIARIVADVFFGI